jgi:hypothetical protein
LIPLSKNNILKVTIEVDDYLLVKDALESAIQVFNKQQNEIIVNDNADSYKIRFSKKSGLPDTDLPCKLFLKIGIDPQMTIKMSNIRNFSIIVEDHLKTSYSTSFVVSSGHNINNTDAKEDVKRVSLLDKEGKKEKNNKKRCCYLC